MCVMLRLGSALPSDITHGPCLAILLGQLMNVSVKLHALVGLVLGMTGMMRFASGTNKSKNCSFAAGWLQPFRLTSRSFELRRGTVLQFFAHHFVAFFILGVSPACLLRRRSCSCSCCRCGSFGLHLLDGLESSICGNMHFGSMELGGICLLHARPTVVVFAVVGRHVFVGRWLPSLHLRHAAGAGITNRDNLRPRPGGNLDAERARHVGHCVLYCCRSK
mmetsp:Transcript_1706/g.3737  ORF Transcript_1706/g.3737 Transcript_1706/m.3737 type:complete len:220 (-) Transcript_1706:29-688(-)